MLFVINFKASLRRVVKIWITVSYIMMWAALGFSLSGCSIGGTYYVRNFTAETARLILTFTELRTKIDEAPTFRCSEGIKTIKRNLHKHLDDSISGKYLSATTLQIEIPPNSTVFFAIGSNMRIWGIEKIQIESRSESQVISPDDTEKLNIRMRGIGQYTGHLDIR